MKKMLIGFLTLLVMVSGVDAACYLIYDGRDKVVYQGSAPPVDMSLSVSNQIQTHFPGGHLVFMMEGMTCSAVDIDERATAGTSRERAVGRVSSQPQFPESEIRLYVSETASGDGQMLAPWGRGSGATGSEIAVKSYFRRDGSFVQAHTRAAPRRR